MSDLTKLSRRSVLAFPLVLGACKFGRDVLEVAGSTMGTTFKVVAVDDGLGVNAAELRGAVETALLEVNKQLSNWDATSEISKFNAHRGTDQVALSPMLGEVMQAADLVNKASRGRFDTTIGPLIELWGFGAPGGLTVPSDDEVSIALGRSGHADSLEVGTSSMRKRAADSQVYLAAIGKGFGADYVGRALEQFGFRNYLIEIGGDLYAAGRNPSGLPWQIGIERPMALSGGVLDVVGISGLGLASSGDYRNYFERDGVRFSHVIDPATGRPITHHTASATVLADNAMLADAWATAMLILGRDQGMEVAREHDIAVLFIDRDTSSSDIQFTTSASERFTALTA